MMKIKLGVPTTLFILSLLLNSCSVFQSAESSKKPLLVEFTYRWGDYTLLVAQKKGLFEKYAVEVQPVYYPVFSESFPDLAAGQIDAALIAVGDVMNIDRHTQIKVVGLSDDGSFMPIVARPEYNSIRDLSGKTIGVLVGSQYEVLVSEMLASAGMDAGDVFINELDPAKAVTALKNNQVQAAFVWEPYTRQAIANGDHILYPTDRTLRIFPNTIAFRETIVKERPDDIRNFLKAWYEAANYRSLHPEETSQIAADFLGVPLVEVAPDSDLKVLSLADNNHLFQRDQAGSIYETTQRTGNYLVLTGALASLPDFSSMLDASYLP